MKKKNKIQIKKTALVSTTLVGILISGNVVHSSQAHGVRAGEVKCKGVAVKWGNNCGAKGHSCSGKAKTNFDPEEWVALKKEDCAKVTEALKDPAIKSYVELMRDRTENQLKRRLQKMKSSEKK